MARHPKYETVVRLATSLEVVLVERLRSRSPPQAVCEGDNSQVGRVLAI